MTVAADRVHRPYVLVCIMLTVFMASIEITIVAMAMPQIVGALGGFELYGWVFASLLLAQTSTTVIFGKLADLYGRKPILIAGIVIFLVGSLLCGFATTMPALIAFRAIQGFGAGSMQAVSMTVFGDLYTPEERTRIQAALAAIWGLSALLGPMTGALIIQYLSWPWVFWINLPIGIAAIAGLSAFLHENVQKRESPIDYRGAALVAVSVVTLLLLLTQLAEPVPDYGTAAICAAVFTVALPLLYFAERRAADPIVQLSLWLHPVIAPANAATLTAGLVFMGATTFLPVYVQVVMGETPIIAGIALTTMAIGWPVAASLARRLYRVIGMQNTARLGGVFLFAGIGSFLLLRPDSGALTAAAGSFVAGAGLGLLMTTSVVLVQGSVEWAARGSATAANVFARTLGNTLGAAALGSILNLSLIQSAGIAPAAVRRLLQEHAADVTAESSMPLLAALDHALHLTFWGMFAFAAITLVIAWTIPQRQLHELSGGIPARSTGKAAAAPD